MQDLTPIGLQRQINRLGKLNYKQILYTDGPLSGPSKCCHVLGIDNSSGDIYYKDENGEWQLAIAGGMNDFWSLDGDAGTTPGTNFLGTTDNVGLMFKTNSIQSGYIDLLTQNTSFGYSSLLSNTTGNAGVAIGYEALRNNTGGNSNTAIGNGAMKFNITGGNNVAIGPSSLIIGTNSSSNVAIGPSSMYSTTGSSNTALGYLSLFQNTSGDANIAIGKSAGEYNTTASNQIFINSISRTNYTGDQTASPIYIQQNATVASQKLFTNGALLNLSGTTRNITTSTAGTFINGETTGTATLTTSAIAALISAQYTGTSSAALASGIGSYILGNGTLNGTTSTPALTTVSGNGSGFLGSSSGGQITASGQGSFIQGTASRNGIMTASNVGSSIIGYVTASSGVSGAGTMTSSGLGSMARGSSQDTGIIEASAQGTFASGRASGPGAGTSRLMATGVAAHAFGNAETGGDILCGAHASIVTGQAESDSVLSSTAGHGTLVTGWSTAGGTITNSADASFVGGYASGDTLSNSGIASFLWGQNMTNSAANSFLVGWNGYTLFVQDNSIVVNGDFFATFGNGAGINTIGSSGLSIIGDVNDTVNSNKLTVDDVNQVAYYDNGTHLGKFGVNINTPLSTVDIIGGIGMAISTITTDWTIDDSYYTVLVDATTANTTITLPPVALCPRRIYNIKKIDATANTVTIQADGAETIDGLNTQVISTQWTNLQIQCDGTAWYII